MTTHRYTFTDAYILAELKSRYDAADPEARIRLLADLYKDNIQPPYEIAELAVHDTHVEVRRWIARNGQYLSYKDSNTTEPTTNSDARDLRKRLKIDSDPLVRAHLRENPDIMPLFFRADNSKQWFLESSHLERLALVRNEGIDEDFVGALFNPDDKDLVITLSERFELCCAFLTNHVVIEKNAKDAGLTGHPLGSLDGWARSSARQFLSSLWLKAVKWPRDSGGLQYAVYTYVPTDDATKAEVYGSCDERHWRKAILYKSDAKRDSRLFALALRDGDDDCRELAYQLIHEIDEAQLGSLLNAGDKAALRGLADNRAIPEPRQSDVQRRVRQRLKEVGESTSAFEHFDLMHVHRRVHGRDKRIAGDSHRRLIRRLRVVQRSIDGMKAQLDRVSSFYSLPSLIFFACAVGFVAALFVRWLR